MIGTLLNERYRLDAELGRGGMGRVYRAHDTLLDRDVAVKVLSATKLGTEGRARLLRRLLLHAESLSELETATFARLVEMTDQHTGAQIAEVVHDLESRLLWARLNLDNPNQQAVQIARGELSAICRAVRSSSTVCTLLAWFQISSSIACWSRGPRSIRCGAGSAGRSCSHASQNCSTLCPARIMRTVTASWLPTRVRR